MHSKLKLLEYQIDWELLKHAESNSESKNHL